jgi:hypothetical protein
VTTFGIADHVAAGYVVTRAIAGHPYLSPELLPDTLISLSPDIAPAVAVTWGSYPVGSRERRWDEALAFGLRAEHLERFAVCSNAHWGSDVGHDGVFYTLDAARAFVAEFLSNDDTVLVLGMGLPVSLVDAFLGRNRLLLSGLSAAMDSPHLICKIGRRRAP